MGTFFIGRSDQIKAIVASVVSLVVLLKVFSPEVAAAGASVLLALVGLVDRREK